MNSIKAYVMASMLILVMPIVSCTTARSTHRQSLPSLQTIIGLAEKHKAEWLRQNPSDSKIIGPATIKKVGSTSHGWHVLFEHITFKGESEGEGHHYLHVYIDTTGVLQSIVRGPDEIALKSMPQPGVVADGSRLHIGPQRQMLRQNEMPIRAGKRARG